MIEIRGDYRPSNDELNRLNEVVWDHDHHYRDYGPTLDRSLGYICAFKGSEIVGFVNVAWDGGGHAFILDTCVIPSERRQGIASQMIGAAVALAKKRGACWLHVDYEPHLQGLYEGCGFRSTKAGLIDLTK